LFERVEVDGVIMTRHLRGSVLALLWLLISIVLVRAEEPASAITDPGVPDGEQIVWRVSRRDKEPEFTTITWRAKNRDSRPVYEITTVTAERKQAKYAVDRRDLRLIWCRVLRDTEDGKSEVVIEVKDGYQHLTHDFENNRKEKKIEHKSDGYNGSILLFSLRGFPFGKQSEVSLRLTPPFIPDMPLWIWRMWKSRARFLGEERVTVPAGTFDCYKLEVAASGGLIRRFTSEYYLWYAKEPPHHFVKYQDTDGKSVTELMEIGFVDMEDDHD